MGWGKGNALTLWNGTNGEDGMEGFEEFAGNVEKQITKIGKLNWIEQPILN